MDIGAWVTLTLTRSGKDEYTYSTSLSFCTAKPGRQEAEAEAHAAAVRGPLDGPLDAAARAAYRAARAEVAEVPNRAVALRMHTSTVDDLAALRAELKQAKNLVDVALQQTSSAQRD